MRVEGREPKLASLTFHDDPSNFWVPAKVRLAT